MKILSRSLRAHSFFGLILAIASVEAAPIPYGNFTGTNVKFLGVTENSGTDPTALFGAPIVSGNTLDFDPFSFSSFSSGAGHSDITDGTLTFNLASLPGNFLQKLRLEEQGDVTLVGFGGVGTYASIRTSVFINVLAVDGVSINPLNITSTLVFTPFTGAYNLLTNAGGGPFYNTIWSGLREFDITQALIDNHIPFQSGATLVSVTLDNTLVTLSEAGTSSFIAKKDFQGITITGVVPEVSSMVMMSIAAGGICVVNIVRRRARLVSR